MAIVQNSFYDFTPFPRDQSYPTMAHSRPDDIYGDLSFMGPDYQSEFPDMTSTYDSYSSAPAFATAAEMSYYDSTHLGVNGPKEYRTNTPASPSTSMSHSGDQSSSNFSHASATSGQSAASSTVGSPYSHTTQNLSTSDQWIENNALGINREFGTYHLQPTGAEHVPYDENKYSGSFVGELAKVPSFSPIISSPISFSPTSSSVSATSPIISQPLALDPPAMPVQDTIDRIIEEATSPSSAQPASPSSAISSFYPSPIAPQKIHPWPTPDQQPASSFKSPVTPASAHPYNSRSGSPYGRRRQDPPRRSSLSSEISTQSSPSLSHQPLVSQPSPNHNYGNHFQASFFKQSSGRFVAPLESSCWFFLLGSFCSLSLLLLSRSSKRPRHTH